MAKVSKQDLKDDFTLFVCYVWHLLKLPQPTKVQKLIAEYMNDDSKGDRIIEAFRGVGKSYIAYAFVLWKLWNNPKLNFLIISAAGDRADAFSITCQSWIEAIPVLKDLKPEDRSIKYTNTIWSVRGAGYGASPSVKSVGINGMITGTRADYILADDVEVPSNSATVDTRMKLRTLVTEFEAIKKGDEGNGHVAQVIYLGTPQCEESLYNHLHESGFHCRIWPAKYPDKNKLVDYKGKICPVLEDELYTDESLIGRATDPARFTDADLLSRHDRYGKAGFALQFMLDTELSDELKYPLRTADLLVYSCPDSVAPRQLSHGRTREANVSELYPRVGFSSDRWYQPIYVDKEFLPFEGTVLAVDPSGRGGDETGYAVVKHLMGHLFIVEAGGLEGGYDEENVLKPLSMIAKRNGVTNIIIESNFGDGMFSQLWKPILHAVHPCTMEEVRHNVNKEKRIIDTLEPVMARHKLIIAPEVIEHDYRTSVETKDANGKIRTAYSLMYQLTHITKEKGAITHDDRLDALAIGVAYFTERLNRDANKEIQYMKDKQLQDQLDRIYNRNRIRAEMNVTPSRSRESSTLGNIRR